MLSMKAVDFITLTTSVPKEFVEDLFSFYDENTLQTDFVIQIKKVCKWLKCSNTELVRTLNRSYISDIDFKRKKVTHIKKQGVYGSNYHVQYMITADCFKRLCMVSHSKNAELVRTYFIQVENAFIKYRHQTMSGIEQELEMMKNNKTLLGDKLNGEGYIYILKASKDKDSVYKIGRSEKIRTRIGNYNTGRAEDVEVRYLYRTNNVLAVEACVKGWLKENQYRRCKEVYQADLEMIKDIIKRCDAVGDAKLEYKKTGKSKMEGGWYIMIEKQQLIEPNLSFSTVIEARPSWLQHNPPILSPWTPRLI